MKETVKASDLRPGDVVDLEFSDGFGTAIVREVWNDQSGPWVRIYRPYGTNSDFFTSGREGGQGVITYLGVEDFVVDASPSRTFVRLRKSSVQTSEEFVRRRDQAEQALLRAIEDDKSIRQGDVQTRATDLRKVLRGK